MTASLLPNGKQSFFDLNGDPLVGGKVYFYVPDTLVPKNTWQDSAQSTANTNPVVLDERGEAVIYGSGTYRQILKDALGNTIWDQPSAAPGIDTGGGAASTAYEIVIQNLDGSNLCDLGGLITEQLSVAFLTPDDPSDPYIQNFGVGRMGQTVFCFITSNVGVLCDGAQIIGNKNARASGRDGFPMSSTDSFIATCMGSDTWMFQPFFSEINRRTWPTGAGSGAEPQQAYLTLSELYPNNDIGGPQNVLQNFLMGGAYVLGDLNTHKFQAGGLRLMNADDSAAIVMMVCARDGATDALKQTDDFSNQSNWAGLMILCDDLTNWNGGVAFVPGAANLPPASGVPGSLFQGLGVRWFFMPTARPEAYAEYASVPAGFAVETAGVGTQANQAAMFVHDNGCTIFYGAGRYENAAATGELDPYPYHIADLYSTPELDADFSLTQLCGRPDTRWQNHRPHASMEGNAVDMTVGGVSNYCGALSVVNNFDKNEALVWGRVGNSRGSPNAGYFGVYSRKVVDRSVQTLIDQIDASTLARNYPVQPSFSTRLSADVLNVTGDGTVYTVAWDSEIFDQGNNVSGSTFTAPVTGRYHFDIGLTLSDVTAGYNQFRLTLVAGGKQYLIDSGDLQPDVNGRVFMSGAVLAPLTAGNTASVVLSVSGSTKSIDILWGAADIIQSFFSGFLQA